MVQHYADLAIEQRDDSTHFKWHEDHPVYRTVKVACWELGFVEQDAECLAKAWRKTCDRLDDFQLLNWPNTLSQFDFSVSERSPFPSCPKELGLYVVAPSAQWIEKLAKAGVKTLQLRYKSDDPFRIDAEVQQAIASVKNYQSHLFINDHWQSAIRHGAYGVHLGQEDLEMADLDSIHKAGLRLGISSHGYQEMLFAAQHQPSYIALGAIFPTTLKKMATAPQGLGRLRKYAELLKDYALVGIGGIDASNIDDVLQCGVGSIAVVRAVTQTSDYEAAIQTLNAYFSST
jgi:thiamine-phosphate pyrophosphorylase